MSDKSFDELIDTVSSANENLFSFFQTYPDARNELTTGQKEILMTCLDMSKELVAKNRELMYVVSK